MDIDVDIDRCFGCFKGASKSVQVLLDDMGAVMVLTSSYGTDFQSFRL